MSEQPAAPAVAGAAPLQGIVVLDVTNVLAGPFATFVLSLLGARIIKVEQRQGGDLARSLGASPPLNRKQLGTSFIAQNCNKQSIAIDLKAERGKEVFRRLVGRSDVLVENFRPGVMDRLGLGYQALQQVRPDLIYCAVSGFGQTGPDAQKPAYDQIIQGKSGLMAVSGTEESGPLRSGIPIADTVGGLNAALGVVAALFQRAMTGQGQFLDVALLDSLMPMMGWVASNYLQAGIAPRRMGNENPTAAPSGVFRARDGIINIAANKQEQWQELCRLLDLPELMTDPRFAERDERKQNRAELTAILNTRLSERSSADWEQLLNEHGIPCGEILTLEQALNQQQVTHRNLLQQVEDPDLGRLTVFGLPICFAHPKPQTPPLKPPPRLGEHSRDILTEIHYSPAEIEDLIGDGIVGPVLRIDQSDPGGD